MYIARVKCISLKLFAGVLLAIPVIWTGAWMSHAPATKCERHLNAPFLVVGIFFLILALVRLILWQFIQNDDVSSNNNKGDNCISFCLLVLFLVVLGYTVFGLVVGIQGGGGAYQHSKWLRNRVADSNRWRNFKNCLIFKNNVCSAFVDKYKNDSYQQFLATRFSSTQSGCCEPLKVCNFTYISPAVWTNPTNETTFSNPDCGEWSNDPYTLCFNCQSCKDGFIHDIGKNWKKAAIVNITVLILLVMLLWCGDCGDDPED